MNITKKKHLEIAIENIPKFESPKIDLEQYSTPAPIAADLLWNAKSLGDITNKSILDLGCGTGILGLSSIFLGAKSVTGFDIDSSSIELVNKTVEDMNISNTNFFLKDIYDISSEYIDSNFEQFNLNFDTAITNPPFGAQSRVEKGADRIFMELALKSSNVVYSFHMAETEGFVKKYYETLGGELTHKFSYKFPLVNSYEFHNQEIRYIDVVVFRVINLDNPIK